MKRELEQVRKPCVAPPEVVGACCAAAPAELAAAARGKSDPGAGT